MPRDKILSWYFEKGIRSHVLNSINREGDVQNSGTFFVLPNLNYNPCRLEGGHPWRHFYCEDPHGFGGVQTYNQTSEVISCRGRDKNGVTEISIN